MAGVSRPGGDRLRGPTLTFRPRRQRQGFFARLFALGFNGKIPGGLVSWIDLEVRGKKIRVAIVRGGEGVWIGWEGQGRYLGPERALSAVPGATEREVRAPMTGRVVKVAATSGAAVRLNEVLVVLEAMKMEYRLVAPREGTIESVGCREGDRVDLGHVLVTLAP